MRSSFYSHTRSAGKGMKTDSKINQGSSHIKLELITADFFLSKNQHNFFYLTRNIIFEKNNVLYVYISL